MVALPGFSIQGLEYGEGQLIPNVRAVLMKSVCVQDLNHENSFLRRLIKAEY